MVMVSSLFRLRAPCPHPQSTHVPDECQAWGCCLFVGALPTKGAVAAVNEGERQAATAAADPFSNAAHAFTTAAATATTTTSFDLDGLGVADHGVGDFGRHGRLSFVRVHPRTPHAPALDGAARGRLWAVGFRRRYGRGHRRLCPRRPRRCRTSGTRWRLGRSQGRQQHGRQRRFGPRRR